MGNSRKTFLETKDLKEVFKSVGFDSSTPLIEGEGSKVSCAKEAKGINSPDKNKSTAEIAAAYDIISKGLLVSLDKSIKRIYAR